MDILSPVLIAVVVAVVLVALVIALRSFLISDKYRSGGVGSEAAGWTTGEYGNLGSFDTDTPEAVAGEANFAGGGTGGSFDDSNVGGGSVYDSSGVDSGGDSGGSDGGDGGGGDGGSGE